MAKKYVISSLMIVAALLALGGLVAPFYTSYISQVYGDTLVQGSIIITGLGFALGLDAIGTDYFHNQVIRVIPQTLITIILIFLVILLVASIVSTAVRKKNSIFYSLFNGVIGITSLVIGVLTALSNSIMNITLDGNIGLEEGGILEGGLVSEGIGFGAIITAIISLVLAALALTLAAICFYDYKNQDDGLRTYPHYAGSLDYTEEPLLIEEEKEPRRLFFNKKEKVVETEEENKESEKGVSVTSDDHFHTNTQTLDVDEVKSTDDVKEDTLNESLVNESDQEVKDEIETPQVEKRKKTLEEKLADLTKLHQQRKITDAEYKKYKDAVIEEHFASRGNE